MTSEKPATFHSSARARGHIIRLEQCHAAPLMRGVKRPQASTPFHCLMRLTKPCWRFANALNGDRRRWEPENCLVTSVTSKDPSLYQCSHSTCPQDAIQFWGSKPFCQAHHF